MKTLQNTRTFRWFALALTVATVTSVTSSLASGLNPATQHINLLGGFGSGNGEFGNYRTLALRAFWQKFSQQKELYAEIYVGINRLMDDLNLQDSNVESAVTERLYALAVSTPETVQLLLNENQQLEVEFVAGEPEQTATKIVRYLLVETARRHPLGASGLEASEHTP